MDDDFTFGASVWGAPETVPATSKLPPPDFDDPFDAPSPAPVDDDFDDFGDPPTTNTDAGDDDDFGDFGDFDEAEAMPAAHAFAFEEAVAGPSSSYGQWEALRLAPMPSQDSLEEDLENILGPIWTGQSLADLSTDEPIREMEGINQILVTPESRNLYNMLVQSPPSTQPPNWIRSRIRRQHLIALGIPVNLDEVLPPHSKGSPLPPLHITTRPMSAPPGARGGVHPSRAAISSASNSRNNSRAGSPHPRDGAPGSRPAVDNDKIQELLSLDMNAVSIEPLATLEHHLKELRVHTAQASARLTYLLQTRDALQQDSETYNGLIAELVGEATKAKSGKGRNPIRRGSGMV
ncbi:hypothetical protein CYLTODRAFT_420449 [Cylindrobasidium torrendii FP15055 ss-10]|uniref:Uncharacterized protein n=1 Tax=Cylindrobasidium torrendii FP15055 ss-10 TaxID=1314674 RepID=A0A0D7BJG6_9AGAR|nr:hypothetical protein CYLTODRAFT_420449 [Cylindrobasidium torrendii FP15055 ss-10]